MSEGAQQSIDRYLSRHGHRMAECDTLPAPHPKLRASVVIPAYDELGNIDRVLGSLEQASDTPEVFEVIVVVNNGRDAPEAIVSANLQTLAMLEQLDTSFAVHAVDRASAGRAYDPDIAGVGLARREGADLALARLASIGQSQAGLLPCLDGDSPVAPGYIDQILAEFDSRPDLLAGVCRYRHPLPKRADHARAIAAYEAWMRYWEAAMASTGSPYAFQSIGSCMVLTARGYALADGMPTRQALSDFYVLEKVIKAGGRGAVAQLAKPLVYPSARPSERVPRGTGPSVRMQLESRTSRFEMAEPPAAFAALAGLFGAARAGFERPSTLREALDDGLLPEYLDDNNAWETFAKLRDNAPTPAHFERHFHSWFDNLKIVKFANVYKRRRGGMWIFEAVRQVYGRLGIQVDVPKVLRRDVSLRDWRALLAELRRLELAGQ